MRMISKRKDKQRKAKMAEKRATKREKRRLARAEKRGEVIKDETRLRLERA